MDDCRPARKYRQRERERTDEEAHEPAPSAFSAPFASDLKVHERELLGEPRGEKQAQVRADAAHRFAVRAEQDRHWTFHAASRNGPDGMRAGKPAVPCSPNPA